MVGETISRIHSAQEGRPREGQTSELQENGPGVHGRNSSAVCRLSQSSWSREVWLHRLTYGD